MKDARLTQQTSPRAGRAHRSQIAVVARYVQDVSTRRSGVAATRRAWAAGCAPQLGLSMGKVAT
jgi:hypothetical protein